MVVGASMLPARPNAPDGPVSLARIQGGKTSDL
jgi:hypothetical protein